ncbi:hypothetical protein ACQ4PT_012008 [Festuca glaucescens]
MVSASTGAMNALLGKLTTLMGEEFSKLKNLRKEVKFISDELGSMKGTLEMLGDVDNLDPQTERWRDTLREMSYDIEDIIDDFMHHIGEKSKNRWFARKIARLLKEFRARYRIANRVKEIKALVLETSARRQRYKFDIPSSSDVSIDPRLATLYENAANLVGVQAPMHEIISWVNDKEKQLKNSGVKHLLKFASSVFFLTHSENIYDIRGRSIREPIIISGEGAFPALKRFKLRLSRASYLTFQAGAMPKLEMLKLMFNARAPEQNRIAPTGIEHLLALEELHAEIDCDGIRESEKSSVESGLMSAINMHRNHPRVIIDLWDNN